MNVLAGLFGPNSALAPNLFAPNEGIANLIADMETLGPREGVERLMSIFGRAPSRDMTYEALCQLEDVRLTTSKGTLDALPLDMVTVGSEWLDQVRCPADCGDPSKGLQAGTWLGSSAGGMLASQLGKALGCQQAEGCWAAARKHLFRVTTASRWSRLADLQFRGVYVCILSVAWGCAAH